MVITAVLSLIVMLNRCVPFCVGAKHGKCNELLRTVSTLSPLLMRALLISVILVPVSSDQGHIALCYQKLIMDILDPYS